MDLIENLKYIVPFAIIGMLALITFVLSRMGWSDLVARYEFKGVFSGTKIGIVSATINNVNYNGSMILKYNDEGMYLHPVILYRLFHKPVLIPWADIKEVRDRQILFLSIKELSIGNPLVARISLQEKTFNKIRTNIHQGRS